MNSTAQSSLVLVHFVNRIASGYYVVVQSYTSYLSIYYICVCLFDVVLLFVPIVCVRLTCVIRAKPSGDLSVVMLCNWSLPF